MTALPVLPAPEGVGLVIPVVVVLEAILVEEEGVVPVADPEVDPVVEPLVVELLVLAVTFATKMVELFGEDCSKPRLLDCG